VASPGSHQPQVTRPGIESRTTSVCAAHPPARWSRCDQGVGHAGVRDHDAPGARRAVEKPRHGAELRGCALTTRPELSAGYAKRRSPAPPARSWIRSRLCPAAATTSVATITGSTVCVAPRSSRSRTAVAQSPSPERQSGCGRIRRHQHARARRRRNVHDPVAEGEGVPLPRPQTR